MNNGHHYSFTSGWKEVSELDQLSRQISSFLFPKRQFLARCRIERRNFSVTLWKEKERCFLLYVTKDVMRADDIGTFMDILTLALDQIGVRLEEARTRMMVDLCAHDFELNLLERLRLMISKVETHSWLSAQIDQKEFVMLKEAKSPLRQGINPQEVTPQLDPVHSFSESELTSAEMSEFTQLGLELRKIQ